MRAGGSQRPCSLLVEDTARLLEPFARFVEPATERTDSRQREARVGVGKGEVGRERLLTEVALEDFGMVAALEDPEPLGQAVEELSMRVSLA